MTATDPPASLISTLPSQYYTDAAISSLEQTRVFETMWSCAVRSADLPTPGEFRGVPVGREGVLVVRGRDRQLRLPQPLPAPRGADLHRGLR